ncbi:hypothetical protein D3C74_348570 [compost metagenome]
MDGGLSHHFDPDQAVADIVMQLTGNPYPFLSLGGHFDLGGELEQAAAGFLQLKMLFAQLVIEE